MNEVLLEALVFLLPLIGAGIISLKEKLYKTAPFYPLISLILVFLRGFEANLVKVRWLPIADFGIWWSKLGVVFTIVILTISSIVLFYSLTYMKKTKALRRFYSLMLVFTWAMVGLALSPDLIQLFFFWELTTLCSYFLINFNFKKRKARIAGAEAFIITKFGDLALLIGIFLLFLQTKTTLIPEILSSTVPATVLFYVAILFAIAGFAKAAQVPFQIWLPDAMEAPTPVSAFLHSATLVQAPVYFFAVFYPLISQTPVWHFVLYFAAISGIITGLFALGSEDIKRIAAYSTTSQISYMIIAVGLSWKGITAGMFYLASHAMFKSLMFMCSGNIIHLTGERNIKRIGSIAREMPYTFIIFSLAILSLAAIPPLNGFWSKEFMFVALKNTKLKILIDIGFVITVMYAMRLLYYLYKGPKKVSLKIAPAGLLIPEFITLLLMISLIPLTPLYSNLMGTQLPFKWIIDPFVLILIGFVGFYIYYEYLPRWQKKELYMLSTKLSSWYDKLAINTMKVITKILNAKERIWEKIETRYVKFVVENPGMLKLISKTSRSLEVFTPKSLEKSIAIAFIGIVIIMVISCSGL